MKVRLDLDDVDFQFKVSNWRKPQNGEADYDLWTNTELSLSSCYINHRVTGEVLTSGEVADLCHTLNALLRGQIKDEMELDFIEPDFTLRIIPAKRIYSQPGKIYIRNGYVDLDIDLEWSINFWCKDGLSSNVFTMTLDRSDITVLHAYLQTVIGELADNSPVIQALIQQGKILPE